MCRESVRQVDFRSAVARFPRHNLPCARRRKLGLFLKEVAQCRQKAWGSSVSSETVTSDRMGFFTVVVMSTDAIHSALVQYKLARERGRDQKSSNE